MAGIPSENTAQWSSRFAFIMAAVGSSVGLGNLWRFSAEAGSNGGGAFIIIYFACVLIIGIPILMSEYIIGRAGSANSAIRSVKDVAKKSNVSERWQTLGWTGMIASFLIVTFYCVVAAWVIMYIPKFLFGSFDGLEPTQISAQFGDSVSKPMNVLPYFTFFAALTTWLLARGVNKGIEFAAKILMPLFFLLLALLAAYSLWLGFTQEQTIDGEKTNGAALALSFLFNPDWKAVSPSVVTSALGQAFFSIGLGSAIMITYGSYLPKTVDIPKSAIIVALTDSAVALTAGLAIFPIVFAYGIPVDKGPGLFFEALPIALSKAPGGNFIGAAFFFLAIFAAVTSSISLLEPTVAWLSEKLAIARKKAAIIGGAAMWLVGLGSVLSMKVLGGIDNFTGAVMLPVTGLLTILFVGWRMKKAMVNEQMGHETSLLNKMLFILVRYVAPIFVVLVLIFTVDNKYFDCSLATELSMGKCIK